MIKWNAVNKPLKLGHIEGSFPFDRHDNCDKVLQLLKKGWVIVAITNNFPSIVKITSIIEIYGKHFPENVSIHVVAMKHTSEWAVHCN